MISAYVVDLVHGRPAEGVPVRLEHRGPPGWNEVVRGVTGPDGMLAELEAYTGPRGGYRLTVEPGPYFATLGMAASHSTVSTTFYLGETDQGGRVSVFIAPSSYTSFLRH